MVTVRLMGGLGNQMFQYAIGRSMAHDLHEKLILDTTFYDVKHSKTTNWNYELYHLNIKCEILKNTVARRLKNLLTRKISSVIPQLCPRYIHEKTMQYDSAIFNKGHNLYLDGYWQCEKYFYHNADIIRNDFQVITSSDERNQYWFNLINDTTNSVCLHVRRGDYVTNLEANRTHGTCSLDYYHAAIKYFSDYFENPVFFVFSDDIEWAKEYIITEHQTYFMTQNGADKGYEDLRLMMQCKHFIIANSSFSWWGAWLGKYQDKVVVCPKRWFNDPEKRTDIICDSWVRI